jgi:hypothetical protein
VLPNGLTVVLVVDHRSPLVGMELRYRTGRRGDPAGRPGLTILVQNPMVRSTAHLREGDYARDLDAAGAWDSRWLVNDDRTAFRVTVPSNQVALPLWMWSDQMGFFADRLDTVNLDDIGRLQASIDAATPENVRAVVPDPKSWKAIVIGDLASLRAPLLALGWGPLQERDAGGKVLRTIGP